MNFIYYRFEQLPFDETKKRGAQHFSEHRRDCTRIYDPQKTNLLSEFITGKPGHIRLSLLDNKGHINANQKRLADVSLWGKCGNLSSLYCDNPATGYFYGNPKIGTDAYLFYCQNNFQTIELFIIEGGRWMLQNYYDAFLWGEYKNDMDRVRAASIRFQDYIGQL